METYRTPRNLQKTIENSECYSKLQKTAEKHGNFRKLQKTQENHGNLQKTTENFRSYKVQLTYYRKSQKTTEITQKL